MFASYSISSSHLLFFCLFFIIFRCSDFICSCCNFLFLSIGCCVLPLYHYCSQFACAILMNTLSFIYYTFARARVFSAGRFSQSIRSFISFVHSFVCSVGRSMSVSSIRLVVSIHRSTIRVLISF